MEPEENRVEDWKKGGEEEEEVLTRARTRVVIIIVVSESRPVTSHMPAQRKSKVKTTPVVEAREH